MVDLDVVLYSQSVLLSHWKVTIQCVVKSSIIPIPKGTKATLTDSDKYRSIAISSILSKVLDYIIIDNQKLALQTSDYQFGFKSKS